MSKSTKVKFSVFMEQELVDRLDAVAEARGEGRATVIERIARNGIAAEEDFLRQLEKPHMRWLLEGFSNPEVLIPVSKLIGDEVSEDEARELREKIQKQIARGADRGAARKSAGRRRDSKTS